MLALVGCQHLYTATVTVTEVRNSIMTELGELYKQGKISEETDAKITAADKAFRDAAKTLEITLVAYKNGSENADTVTAFLEVKKAVNELINLLAPYVFDVSGYQNNLNKATKL